MTDLLGSIFEVAYTSLVVVYVFIVGLIGYSHNSVSCNKIREAPLEDWKTLLKVCSSVLDKKKTRGGFSEDFRGTYKVCSAQSSVDSLHFV